MVTEPTMALVVENLPQTLAIVDVKDFFARDATDKIASVVLRKTPGGHRACVKYSCSQACTEALERFNTSSFRGKRLACKIEDVETEKEFDERRIVTSEAKQWSTPSTEWAPRGAIVETNEATCVLWRAEL